MLMDDVSLIPLSLFYASTCCIDLVSVVDDTTFFFLMSVGGRLNWLGDCTILLGKYDE